MAATAVGMPRSIRNAPKRATPSVYALIVFRLLLAASNERSNDFARDWYSAGSVSRTVAAPMGRILPGEVIRPISAVEPTKVGKNPGIVPIAPRESDYFATCIGMITCK